MTRTTAIRKIQLPMLLGVLVALGLASGPAAAQSNCKWYAATALKQQQQNEKLGCKLTGPEWHTDLNRHMEWCGRVPPDMWKTSAQQRDQALADCAAKAK